MEEWVHGVMSHRAMKEPMALVVSVADHYPRDDANKHPCAHLYRVVNPLSLKCVSCGRIMTREEGANDPWQEE
jgi:hypothetical protein